MCNSYHRRQRRLKSRRRANKNRPAILAEGDRVFSRLKARMIEIMDNYFRRAIP